MKVFKPTKKETEAMFKRMQTEISLVEKKAVPGVNYKPDYNNLSKLFLKEWQHDKMLNQFIAILTSTRLWYFAEEKGGTLYELMQYSIPKECAITAIHHLNMPADTWRFLEWFHEIVSYDYLKENLENIPKFKHKGIVPFVQEYKLLPKIYKLWKK